MSIHSDDYSKPVYKVYKEKKFAIEFVTKGRIMFGNQLSYRFGEDEERRDPTESEVCIKVNEKEIEGYLQNRVFIFCCYSHDTDLAIMKGKGEYVVIINDKESFKNDVYSYMVATGQSVIEKKVRGDYVKYDKGSCYPVRPNSNEFADLSIFQKPDKYCDDKEYRFAITFSRPYIINDMEKDPIKDTEKDTMKDTDKYTKPLFVELNKRLKYTTYYKICDNRLIEKDIADD